jgi:hypothetical protein
MLKTLQAPPRVGSLRESVLLLALMMTEHIDHAKFRAMAQVVIDKDKGMEAFDEYMKTAFPYLETQKTRERQQYIDILKNELKHGALAVKPVVPPTLRSRLKEKHQQREKPLTRDQERNLYTRLDKTRLDKLHNV